MLEIHSGTLDVATTDVKALLQLSAQYGEKYMLKAVLPLVKKYASNVDFVIAFLTELSVAVDIGIVRLEVVQNFYRDILGDFTADFELHCQSTEDSPQRCEYPKRSRFNYKTYGSSSRTDLPRRTTTAENLSAIFHHCERLGLSQQNDQLIKAIAKLALNTKSMTFETLLLPLLRKLPPPNSPSSSLQYHQTLFHTVLSSYISTYVQPPPIKPTTWRRLTRGCSSECADCANLDTFLSNPQKPQAHFTVNGKRRDHVQERLTQSYCNIETDKTGTPYTLIVAKTDLEWEHAMTEWKQRYGVAMKALDEIGFQKLTSILGEGWKDTIGLGDQEIVVSGQGGGELRPPLGSLEQGRAAIGATIGKDGIGRASEVIGSACR